MTIEFMMGVQIFADIVLCLAIILLVRGVTRELRKRPPGMDQKTFSEFRELIDASRSSTDDLLRALNEVKQIGSALDGKNKVMSSPEKKRGLKPKDPAPKKLSRGEKYKAVIEMARQGLSDKEMADALTLTIGEIHLILDLHKKKNENSASGRNTSQL